MKKIRLSLTQQIFIGLVLGVIAGALIHKLDADPYHKDQAIQWVRVLSRVFINLVKVIIGPLLFSTLVVGIAGAGSLKTVGRIGLKAIVYFEIVTTLALVIGLAAVNLTRPGEGVNLPSEQSAEAQTIAANSKRMTAQDHIVNIFPTSLIKSMADNDVLQLVVFSLIFAIAVSAAGEKGKPMLAFCESLSEAMFKFTNFVMKFAPYGVGAAMAVTVGSKGLAVLKNLALLILTLYGALVVFVVVVLGAVALIVRCPLRRFISLVKEPALLAFTTTSSESAFPKAIENMERLGVPRRIVCFVLPMGYSFNLDGSTLYLSLAAVFVAQASNNPLTIGQQLLIVLTLMLSSKGVAAVPRASLVVLAGTLAQFGLPLEGIAVILGVDELMDMARTATNVIGNCMATVVVARWEGEFRDEGDPVGKPIPLPVPSGEYD
ncbi:MAG: cation:dicarboxylase symporter family transporter [Blastocatellia bacterium]|nr:cation:dicarboxylase symporter family transporter [Blastocatellia bacterium]MBO0798779.1 cation:dicarboxylase symporter family transporter [Blastocatellia bacterium]